MTSLSTKVLLYIFLFLFISTNAKLSVKSPGSLVSKFDTVNGIDYAVLTPQNKLTYKRAFIGNLMLADPVNGCESIKPVSNLGDLSNPILITVWGDCHYAQKVKNAETAGAKMMLLVLKHDMTLNHDSIRELTLTTNIEVLAISKGDGDKLISFLEEVKTKPLSDPDTVVELTYSYDVEKHVNYQTGSKVILDFWFVSADISGTSYSFLEDLAGVLKDFGDKVEFNPHYVVWQCEECVINGFQTQDPRCVSGGRYCDPEPLDDDMLSGSEGVIENMRQLCFKEMEKDLKLGNNWWKYVIGFGRECVDQEMEKLDACREKVYSSEGIASKTVAFVDDCLLQSFTVKSKTDIPTTVNDNKYLSGELETRNQMHVDHYPAFYVNKDRYTGSFRNKYSIQDFICSHFLQDKLPSICYGRFQKTEYTSGDTAVFVTIVLASILIMVIMLYCVRRTVKRQVMVRMNDEISHIVTQYKQFKDKSNSFSAEEEM
jgi:hypothetical protein